MTIEFSTLSGDCRSMCAGSTFARQGGSFMEEEIWKAVPGFNGVEASSFGRVREHGKLRPGAITGKGYKIGRGYLATRLKCHDDRYMKFHRLVALAFLPNPMGLPQVNHIDGSTRNNRPENLEWCDNSHNQKHARDMGLRVALKGESVKTSVITAETAKAIYGAVHAQKIKHRDVAKMFGISKTQVTRIAAKKSWAHIHESI